MVKTTERLPERVARPALSDAYTELTRLVTSLDEVDFLRPSRCAGWSVGDVLFHVLLDAQRALVAFGTPASGPPDVDHVTYWSTWAVNRDELAAAAHARFVRVAAAAYPRPQVLVHQWAETAQAVLHGAATVPGADRVGTQGHVLTVADLLGTLAVEAVVHHLDLLVELPGRPGPRPGAQELTVRTLDALLGPAGRPAWDDLTWVLKGTGRIPLTPAERRDLGNAADRIPLVG